MVALPAYVCGPCTRTQCSQRSSLGLLELELQTSELPCGCWGPNSGSSPRAPGALTADCVSCLSHQGELVYPKALPAPQALGEPQLLLPPRFLHFLCYLVSHESLWCWTPSPGGKAQTWLHQSRNQVHSRPVVWEPSLGQGTPLSPPATALLFLSLCSCSFGWHWISASKTTI